VHINIQSEYATPSSIAHTIHVTRTWSFWIEHVKTGCWYAYDYAVTTENFNYEHVNNGITTVSMLYFMAAISEILYILVL
jgi:hypothetical protein